jgi:hypothetical protein
VCVSLLCVCGVCVCVCDVLAKDLITQFVSFCPNRLVRSFLCSVGLFIGLTGNFPFIFWGRSVVRPVQ